MSSTKNNLYFSFFAPAPSRGEIYVPGFCWCFNDEYSKVYETKWVPCFSDQIICVEFALAEIGCKPDIIFTGPRHFPWSIKNAGLYKRRGERWKTLDFYAKRLKSTGIEIKYPQRGDIHDNIYRYGMYRVAEKLGKIVLPGNEKPKINQGEQLYAAYNLRKVEPILIQKGIVSETIRKI